MHFRRSPSDRWSPVHAASPSIMSAAVGGWKSNAILIDGIGGAERARTVDLLSAIGPLLGDSRPVGCSACLVEPARQWSAGTVLVRSRLGHRQTGALTAVQSIA